MPLTVKTNTHEYVFNGPFAIAEGLVAKSGVYLISTKAPSGRHTVLGLGESENVNQRVNNHDRAQCWRQHIENGLFCSALYCDENTRMSVQSELRAFFNPPCGER